MRCDYLQKYYRGVAVGSFNAAPGSIRQVQMRAVQTPTMGNWLFVELFDGHRATVQTNVHPAKVGHAEQDVAIQPGGDERRDIMGFDAAQSHRA